MENRFYGVYRGKVFDNKSPGNHGQVKVLVPQIMGPSPTGWAWPIEPAGVSLATPAIGQGVWVMFEGGDPNYPLWTGSFGKLVAPLVVASSPTISGHLRGGTGHGGSTGLDLVATLVHMSEKLIELEGRVSALE